MGHGVEGRATPPATLDAATAFSVAATLQALATPSRLLILGRVRHGPCSVTELAKAVNMKQSAVSHQLRLLRNLGLVAGERAGQRIVHRLHDNHVAMLLDEAVHHSEHLRMASTPPTRTSAPTPERAGRRRAGPRADRRLPLPRIDAQGPAAGPAARL